MSTGEHVTSRRFRVVGRTNPGVVLPPGSEWSLTVGLAEDPPFQVSVLTGYEESNWSAPVPRALPGGRPGRGQPGGRGGRGATKTRPRPWTSSSPTSSQRPDLQRHQTKINSWRVSSLPLLDPYPIDPADVARLTPLGHPPSASTVATAPPAAHPPPDSGRYESTDSGSCTNPRHRPIALLG